MSLTGDEVNAPEALRLGMVNHVVPHRDLLVFTRQLASRISQAPAVGAVLALYEQGEDLTINAALSPRNDDVRSPTLEFDRLH